MSTTYQLNRELCHRFWIIHLAGHALFIAQSNEVRRVAYKAVEKVLLVDATGGLAIGLKKYFQEPHTPQILGDILRSETISDDCILYVLDRFFDLADAGISSSLAEMAQTKAFAVLENLLFKGNSAELTDSAKLLALRVPNQILG